MKIGTVSKFMWYKWNETLWNVQFLKNNQLHGRKQRNRFVFCNIIDYFFLTAHAEGFRSCLNELNAKLHTKRNPSVLTQAHVSAVSSPKSKQISRKTLLWLICLNVNVNTAVARESQLNSTWPRKWHTNYSYTHTFIQMQLHLSFPLSLFPSCSLCLCEVGVCV